MTRPVYLCVLVSVQDPHFWHWVVDSHNGRRIASSETFASKGNAVRARNAFAARMLPRSYVIGPDDD